MDQVYIPNKDYKVLVRCMTYNQSKYIKDALNGFAMQQTDFPFVCLVMDDCSTDGEQGVIKAWMERECDMEKAENIEIEKSFVTIVHHKSNLNCQFAFYFLKENLYRKGGKAPMIAPWREHCEYEALCEGDDYWISPEKLQKQVSFLDVHSGYSMCFSNAFILSESSPQKSRGFHSITKSRNVELSEIISSWIIPTASIVVRECVYKNYPSWTSKIYSGDQTLALLSFDSGAIYCMSDFLTVYRQDCGSYCSTLVKSKPTAFLQKEQLKLYTYYSEYTNGKYDDVILPHIAVLEKTIKFTHNKEKCFLLAFSCQPLFFISKMIQHYKNKRSNI